MILRVLLIWASNAVAILVAELLISGIEMDDKWRVIIAGAVFGLVNWLVKPIVTVLALPAIILTVGIALFFVNLLMLYLTSWIVPGFRVNSFGAALGGTIVIWVVNLVLFAVLGLNRQRRRA
ncbi:MAG: phage holin family protein [Ilumatobacteraceae bacterium]